MTSTWPEFFAELGLRVAAVGVLFLVLWAASALR